MQQRRRIPGLEDLKSSPKHFQLMFSDLLIGRPQVGIVDQSRITIYRLFFQNFPYLTPNFGDNNISAKTPTTNQFSEHVSLIANNQTEILHHFNILHNFLSFRGVVSFLRVSFLGFPFRLFLKIFSKKGDSSIAKDKKSPLKEEQKEILDTVETPASTNIFSSLYSFFESFLVFFTG